MVTEDERGRERVDRVGYEVCALKALRESLRNRETWVVGANRYRDPDEDLPKDFDERREDYYAELGQPLEAERFVDELKAEMESALNELDAGIPKNEKVRISNRSGGRISVSKLKPRPEPPSLDALKAEIGRRWSHHKFAGCLQRGRPTGRVHGPFRNGSVTRGSQPRHIATEASSRSLRSRDQRWPQTDGWLGHGRYGTGAQMGCV